MSVPEFEPVVLHEDMKFFEYFNQIKVKTLSVDAVEDAIYL